MTLTEKLASIKVLFRAPDTLTLWGIPYEMRHDCGQEPKHLFVAHRDYVPPKYEYGPKRIDISDWVYLGEPGWYFTYTHEEIEQIKAFVDSHKDAVPGNPYEWATLA